MTPLERADVPLALLFLLPGPERTGGNRSPGGRSYGPGSVSFPMAPSVLCVDRRKISGVGSAGAGRGKRRADGARTWPSAGPGTPGWAVLVVSSR